MSIEPMPEPETIEEYDKSIKGYQDVCEHNKKGFHKYNDDIEYLACYECGKTLWEENMKNKHHKGILSFNKIPPAKETLNEPREWHYFLCAWFLANIFYFTFTMWLFSKYVI